ncbi:MAG: hypothetical protein HYT94_01300 [Parcubacteria group bacterium]|nr:hypothetical protein [Parcubacteria group bacterium]
MKTSSIDRVVGNLSRARKSAFLKGQAGIFHTQNIARLNRASLSKTRDQLKILAEVNTATNILRQKYGLEDFDVPSENVHIIKKETWDTLATDVFFMAETQNIFLKEEPRNIRFAKKIFRAMTQFKSYGAVQKLHDGNGRIAEYRMGLYMRPRSHAKMAAGVAYFQELNDAIVETLTRNYILSQSENPLFKKERDETHEIQRYAKELGEQRFSDEDIYDIRNSKQNEFEIASFTCKQERAALKMIVDDIFWKNFGSGKFPKKDDIFTVFARAMFTGHLFELAHLMDKTFGKGTLRKIATPE